MATNKQISLDEVKKHKNRKSLWVVIHDDVLDVTTFLREHPGGEDTLLEVAGKDGTQAFEDVGHSADARKLLEKYKIGFLSPKDRTSKIEDCCSGVGTLQKKDSKNKSWRSYDGSPSSRSVTSRTSSKHEPRAEQRIQTIIVPRERVRRRRPPPEQPSCRWKWALLALAVAIIMGVAYKKYSS